MVTSQLKFLVFTGVPRSVSSTPLFSISPAFRVREVPPEEGAVETGIICCLLFDLYQVKLSPIRSLKKFRSVPISKEVVFSGSRVGIPLASLRLHTITLFIGIVFKGGAYVMLVWYGAASLPMPASDALSLP